MNLNGESKGAGRLGTTRLALLVVSLLALNIFSVTITEAAQGGSVTTPDSTSSYAQFISQNSFALAEQHTSSLNSQASEAGWRLAGEGFQPPRWSGEWAEFGLVSAQPQAFELPFNSLKATWQADVPSDGRLELDVRVSPDAQNWTLWQTLDRSGQSANFGADNAFLYAQYRVRMFSDRIGSSPVFKGVQLAANRRDLTNVQTARYFGLANIAEAAPATAAAPVAPPTYKVYATREGLVGGTTANGHVIQPRDHFVSLPSWTALSDLGKWDYKVKITTPAGKSAIAPVWDTGPWNFHDDYWHNPRHEFKDLPVGVPQAEKAYYEKHNGGLNENGSRGYRPSGIDSGDGTYWDDLDLDGASTGKLDVTFLWEGSQPAAPVISGVTAYGGWQNGVQIKWATSTPANSWVEYGPTTAYGQTTATYDPLGTSHNRVLTDLAPGQTYNFRVHNRDIYGTEAVSANFTFTTNPPTRLGPTAFQGDKGLGVTVNKDGSGLTVLGARANSSLWNDNPQADYLAGGRIEAGRLAGSGNLDLDFATLCDPKGNNCSMGYGTGYKNFVRFANAKGETLEVGLIHDEVISPGSLTLMIEGNYANGQKLRRYNPPNTTDQKVNHHFHFSWQNGGVAVWLDNTRLGDPIPFNTDGLSLAFLGAGRAKGDIVGASFQNIGFSYDALLPAKS